MALVEQEYDPRMDILDDVLGELSKDVASGLDFITSEFEANRARAQRYYNGESDLATDANRSTYVATRVRDTMRAVKPSLMRVFLSSETPVQYVPASVAQGMIAEQQTQWVTQLFHDLGGYKAIYSAFHSAMLFKLGVVKYYYERTEDEIFRSYTGLTDQMVQMLTSHPMVEVISAEEMQVVGPQGIMRSYDIEVVGRKMGGDIRMEWVPLHEFIISRNATCKSDARVIAHRRNVTRSEATSMGFDPELLEGLNSDNTEVSRFASESEARRGYTVFPSQNRSTDESMDEILLTEAYYRADLEGTGIARLYCFWLGGTSYELLDYERADECPFALFSIDPEPGTVFGKSLYDITHREQDTITSVTRATVDNFHMTNNPRLAVHEQMVNMADVLNNDMGSPIRVRAAGQIQVIDTPFTGAAALPLLQHFDMDLENKTGVTKAASGLDPDAMQSTDKEAVRNTIQLSQGQIELMARNLGETGMKDLFNGLLKLAMTHLDASQLLRTPEGQQPVSLDVFDPKMKSRVEVGLGSGSAEEKMMMLDQIMAAQKETMAQMGPGNPMVTMAQMRTTMADKMRLVGMYNPARYFNNPTPEQEQQFAQQKSQEAQKQQQAQMQVANTQATALQEAEKIKGQVKIQTDTAKNQLEMARMVQKGEIDNAQLEQKARSDFRTTMVKDDLARDQMLQDLYLAVMEMQQDLAKANMIRQEQRIN